MTDTADEPTTSTVWVERRLAGFHCWPEAPPGLDHLAHRHRHLFRVRAEVAVRHAERDVEFFAFAEEIDRWWGGTRECGAASCETIAYELGCHLRSRGHALVEASVATEDEGGATVRWPA